MIRQFSQRIAEETLKHFVDYRVLFKEITDMAQERFEQAKWHEIQQAAVERIDLYEKQSQAAAAEIIVLIGSCVYDESLWSEAKARYIDLLYKRDDFELAETFYNSIYCKVFTHHQLTNEHMFIRSSMAGREVVSGDNIYHTYSMKQGLIALIRQLLNDYSFNVPWENKNKDIGNIARYFQKNMPINVVVDEAVTVEVVSSVFYRNKGAYIVGRIHFSNLELPFILPVLNNNGRVYIDTVISDQDQVSVIFSFTRAYFMVDVNVPSEFIRFLHSLIPMKSIAELYTSIGFYKQGKAEFYRDFVDHIDRSADQFIIAPGIKGMVMTVFTLQSYPIVFKIIKDKFSSSKQITRNMVHERYQLVKRHDRVGRMADTQEFTNLVFPRKRFSQALLQELQRVAQSSLLIDDETVTIKHLWIERRMTPLNIYLDEALSRSDGAAVFHALNEYGKAIKQLAAANIFAGDMLFKNFGVTRHARVVFYDYDEIMYLTDCNFRKIPAAMYPEQEMSAEPWYSVAANDVFPEEFTILIACNALVRKIFYELHSDLLDVKFWKDMQQQVRSGQVVDIFPYRQAQRFPR
ncbi:bifunctional isocitrate dehydrogenase kinase/phosphatase [Neptunomonas antarctica]|uniref:Isocitrate dehydrogenase kinase/phosphatase n=1 Tax=Neptunomonas antarctica TaxID=619304 RepID=A0A1N7PP27_9GAMM|nr:bifunctional isocitrate dehydrogenase kinase/phosphatase [Neptunomonas antarctica]SIT12355.1 isocitrate dehydrogenase kinase/phosphatase [Neptunomonas antarctica]